MRLNNAFKQGFTLIEVLVVAPIVVLVVGTFIAALMYLTGDALTESGKVTLMNNTQAAIDKIESDVKMSGAFLAVNNMTLTSPQGFNDATQNFTNTGLTGGAALILNTFVTDKNPTASDRALVMLANLPNPCNTTNTPQNQVMTMNTVYYVKNGTLWKRTLATNGYAAKACNSAVPWQRPSCTPGLTGAMCLTQDEALLTVNGPISLSIDYYASPSSTSPVVGATSGTDAARQIALDSTRTVRVTINATNTVSGRDVTQNASIRATRVGSLVKYATPN